MRLEEQVLTIEQAKHLQELGMDMSDAALCWAVGEMSFQDTKVRHQSVVTMDSRPQRYAFVKEIIPTYTLQEVLDKLPEEICKTSVDRYTLNIDLGDREGIFYDEYSNDEYWQGDCLIYYSTEECSLIEAAYYMLCWVLENGYYGE